MVLNLVVPQGQQGPTFFAILTAYEPVYGQHITSISGLLNDLSFTCSGNRCDVPITQDSSLVFWATSSAGDESQHVQAVLRVDSVNNVAAIRLESLAPISFFQDSCALIWGSAVGMLPDWASFPASPDLLNTMKPYQLLAGRLVTAGLVDAQDCPGSGLRADGAPNTCGLERAAGEVVAWQNQFDITIWETGRSLGIPPRLIKALFEQETQFWPGNGQRGSSEYGLGQLSPAGADVALRWDNDLFDSTCNGLLYDCSSQYGRLGAWEQAALRGGLMRALNAECAGCPGGISLPLAYNSIPVFARTLRANCRQVNFLMDLRKLKAGYEDMWKFTFLSYHAGYKTLADALFYADYNKQPTDWEHVSAFLPPQAGKVYVDNIWRALNEFDAYRVNRPAVARPESMATFAPTAVVATPTPTPAAIRSMSKIRVLVYVDQNANARPDLGERTEGVNVVLTFPDGALLTARTAKGDVVFDVAGRAVGENVLISLPELYRTVKVRITRDGEIPVDFRLEQPVLPPALP
jgi:hypothetical protein